MGSQLREWVGFQQFPSATVNKLVELFGKLKEEGVSTLTILVMGKGGVGKSSTVNSLIGERVVNVNSFQSEALRPVMVSRTRAGFTLNIIDTPGLVEGGYVNYQALELIKRFLLNKTINVLVYVDRLDSYRVDDLDRQIISAISDSFGKEIWRKSLLVLTHAQLCPPDDISYDVFCARRSEAVLKTIRMGARFRKKDIEIISAISDSFGKEIWRKSLLVLTHAQLCPPDDISYDVFCARRSEAVLKTIRMGARFRKKDIEGSAVPVCLVENSGRCNKNELDEKILPNGDAWIPTLVKQIVGVATNGNKAIVVDKKLIDGSEANDRWKKLIPLICVFQWLVFKWIEGAIKDDVASGSK